MEASQEPLTGKPSKVEKTKKKNKKEAKTNNASSKVNEGPTMTRILEDERRRLCVEDCSIYLGYKFLPPGSDKERPKYVDQFKALKNWVEEALSKAGEPVAKPLALMTSAQSYHVITWSCTSTRDTALIYLRRLLQMEVEGVVYERIPGVTRDVECTKFSQKQEATTWFVATTDAGITFEDVAQGLSKALKGDALPPFQVHKVLSGVFPNGNLLITFAGHVISSKKVRLDIKKSSKLLVTTEGKKCVFCHKAGHTAFRCPIEHGLKVGSPLLPTDSTMEDVEEDKASSKSKRSKRHSTA